MPRQTRRPPQSPEHDPAVTTDPDTLWRQVYVQVADTLPGGRKTLGLHAVRVTKAVAGTYTPRPSDLLMLAAAGGNPSRLALMLHGLADAVMAAGADGPDVALPDVVRECGEALAAGAEAQLSGCAQAEVVALREISEGETALRLYGRQIAARRWRRSQTGRRTPLGRVEVMQ